MTRMVLTVQRARVYGKVLSKGDEFDVPEKEARLWGALARAKIVGEPRGYQTASETLRQPGEENKSRRNRYRRTDMRAED